MAGVEPERPGRDLPERRLRRYLIWRFHACRFATVPPSRQSHPRLERVVIEISGLTPFLDCYESYSQQRVRLLL